MPEDVQTGGRMRFRYDSLDRPELSESEKRGVQEGYRAAEERRGKTKKKKIIILVVIILIILAIVAYFLIK